MDKFIPAVFFAVADTQVSRLIVGGVLSRGYLPPIRTPRHPSFKIKLTRRLRPQIPGAHLHHAVGYFKTLPKRLLYPKKLLMHGSGFLGPNEREHFNFGELMHAI